MQIKCQNMQINSPKIEIIKKVLSAQQAHCRLSNINEFREKRDKAECGQSFLL